MGKCISKDQQIKIREIDERSYIAISKDFDYYRYEYDDEGYEDEGQSESKKSASSAQAKKMHGPETKGTSISFGFKKKNYSTSNKKQQIIKGNSGINNNNNNGNSINREKEEQAQKATIISNHNVITAEQNNFIIPRDNNGNTNPAITTSNDEKEFIRTISPAKLQPAKRDQLIAGRSNRFGFRQNVIRPTSAGITPKFNEFDNVNNNSGICRTITTTTQLRSTFQPTKSITDQHTATAVKQNEFDANSISNRPTSATITATSQDSNQTFVVSRYTLQSTSLPRPQYPVSISVAPSFSTYARNTTSYSSLNTHRPVHSVQSKLIDTKGAKHQANLNKRGGMMTRRDESLDSGIASHDSTSDNYNNRASQRQHQTQPTSAQSMDTSVMRRSRRRFEMIPGPCRHKFSIRDLSDCNENAVIVPLSLPKLPTDRREIVTNGLIRSTNSYATDNENETDMSISESSRPTSFISTASEAESFEEEKLKIDTSCSEKNLRGAIAKEHIKSNSKNSSPASWRSDNKHSGGESMAMNVYSSLSISSSDDDRRNQNIGQSEKLKKDIDCDEDDLSSMTITGDHSSYLNSITSKISPSKDQKETVNDAFLKRQQQQSQPKVMGSISRKELFIQVDEVKFAETVAAANNLALLDDETSPSESLVSSSNSESGEAPMKKIIESKQIDEIKEEEDLEDVTPELVDLVSPCSPTHASNSMSLSDPGRDEFLIDDEIADQPALMISTKKQHSSPSHQDDHRSSTSIAMNATSDCTITTPTLKDISINSHGSLKSLNKIQALKTIKSDQSSPAVNRKAIMERSGSLDTLSPCDSIASDDLMADFDLASSLDSIDRHEHSVGDLRVNSENELRNSNCGSVGGGDMKDYGAIFKSHLSVQHRHSSRENITSQLPARATRLLNRRLQNTNNSSPINNGSESPRSLDSMHSRTSVRASLREHLKQRQQQNLQSQLMNSSSEDLLADKSLRNSMLQDVAIFKKELVHLRRLLQESDTLNPFEINGQIFSHLNGSNGVSCENEKEMPSDDKEKKDDEKNVVLTNEQLMLLEDQRQELSDLRRQVVFLQSQIDDKDRLIRQQQIRLDELKMDNLRLINDKPSAQDFKSNSTETANCATQTERLRPVSMGGVQDFTSQQEPSKSQKDETKQFPTITIKSSPPRSKTQISSVYTKLSSIKPTASTSSSSASGNKNSSIPTSPSKPMKSTKIEHPKTTPLRMQSSANISRGSDLKTPLRRSIPQLVKNTNSASKNSPKTQKMGTTSTSAKANRIDDSNGNSATSSLSTSSSNSSINDKHHNKNNIHPDSNGIGFLAHQLNEIYSRGLLE